MAKARELAQSLGIPVNTIPLACLVLAAWRMAGRDSIGVSFAYCGRDRPGTRALIGVFHRRVPLLAERIGAGDLSRFLTTLAGTVSAALRFSRAPYSAAEFDAAVRSSRAEPAVDLLYNQVAAEFGRSRTSRPLQVAGRTTVEFLDAGSWPGRWRSYAEPRLRLVVGGGACPTMRVIFNDGYVAEDDARCLLDSTRALLDGMTTDHCGCPLPEFVESMLAAQT